MAFEVGAILDAAPTDAGAKSDARGAATAGALATVAEARALSADGGELRALEASEVAELLASARTNAGPTDLPLAGTLVPERRGSRDLVDSELGAAVARANSKARALEASGAVGSVSPNRPSGKFFSPTTKLYAHSPFKKASSAILFDSWRRSMQLQRRSNKAA